MKILFILDSLNLGGAERQALLLAEMLREKGHTVVIWGFGLPGAVATVCEQKGFASAAIPYIHTARGGRRIGALYRFARDIRALAPDIILPYCTYPSTFCALVWRFTVARACIWNQRDAGMYEGLHQAYPFAVKMASSVVSNSTAGSDFLRSLNSGLEVHVIHNGVCPLIAQCDKVQWRVALGADEITFLACMVANLGSLNKNHALLIRAWSHGLNTGMIPPNSRLVLAGRFDDATTTLKSLVKDLSLEGSVLFLGPVDDIAGLLESVDVGVLSSRFEGISNAILEYMQAGLPVVASDIDGNREVLGAQSPNILFDGDSEKACAQGLGEMLGDAAARAQASAYNRERSRACFSPEAMASSYERLFEQCCVARRKLPWAVYAEIGAWFGHKALAKAARKVKAAARFILGDKASRVPAWLESIYARSPLAFKAARTVPAKPKIGFAILAHERPEYLRVCLDTLFASDIEGWDVTFLIHDDGSVDPEVRKIIEEPRDSKYTITRVFKPKGHNSWGAAFNSAMRELQRIGEFDIMGSCDSDALFHPQWLQKTLPIFIWAKKHHKQNLLGPFSPFNSSDASFHKILGVYESPFGKYVVKERMGALVYLFFREDGNILGHFPEDKNDETLKTAEMIQKRMRNCAAWESYVEHVGQDSVLNAWRSTQVARAVHGLHLAPSGWPGELESAATLGYFASVASRSALNPVADSATKLDILIPATDKDLDVLPLVIESVQRNLGHPLGTTYVVAPASDRIKDVVKQAGGLFVDEREVAPLHKSEIMYSVEGYDRSGWMLQQFIKLSCDNIASTSHCFIIDADTILICRQKFEDMGKAILLVSDEFHQPYYRIFHRLLGHPTQDLLSFVSHMMCFEMSKLKELRQAIESHTGDIWWKAILNKLDRTELSGFSEYELYGHWMLGTYSDAIKREYFMNKALPRHALSSLGKLEAKFGPHFRAVSFHDYMQ